MFKAGAFQEKTKSKIANNSVLFSVYNFQEENILKISCIMILYLIAFHFSPAVYYV